MSRMNAQSTTRVNVLKYICVHIYGRKGGKAAQIVRPAGALVSGAPPDASGQPTNKAAMDWSIMGAEEGTRDMTWEQIEEGAASLRGEGGAIRKTAASRKRKSEGGISSGMVRKAACLAMRQDDHHSHACIVPECGMFCTPEVVTSNARKTTIRFRHLCRVAQK